MTDSPALVGTPLVGGSAAGEVLHADVGLSFWGGVDPLTGVVIDHYHPLHGASVAGKVLAIPSGRGSCTGSQVLLELILNGLAPAAILLRELDSILVLGVVVAEELFGRSLPVLLLEPEGFAAVARREGRVEVESEGAVGSNHLVLSDGDRSLLEGREGKAAQAAMRIVARIARLQGARELVDVTQAHIDGVTYIGPASLRFAQQFVEWGGAVRVPTTLNSMGVDQRRWRELGVPSCFGEPASALGDAYVDLGAKPTFTCAPYLLDSAPSCGEQVAWGESNAVVFANSVLGARTQKYADFLDICIAITGRAPRVSCHLDERRRATVVLRVAELGVLDDSFWPTLGYLAGLRCEGRVPVITGLPKSQLPDRDDLKALSAAFGTAAAAPMFHLEGVTPEAPDVATALGGDDGQAEELALTAEDLAETYRRLGGGVPGDVQLVALGNPHLSAQEHEALAELVRGKRKHPDVEVTITTGRDMLERARAAGHVAELEAFGATFITDTCWCMLGEPVVPVAAKTLITNSAKYAHYAPGLVGREVRFSSLAGCVSAACSGRAPSAPGHLPRWLPSSGSGGGALARSALRRAAVLALRAL